MFKRSIAVFVVSAFVAIQAQAKYVWKRYVNERFGFSLTYPSTLIPTRPDPIDGAGREYHTPDKQFSICTEGHFLLHVFEIDESLESFWRDELKNYQGQITYKKRGDSWYVVSGITTNGQIFYDKLFTQGGNWATFEIRYPNAQRKKYDPWVVRIEKTFVPFVKGKKGQYDRAE